MIIGLVEAAERLKNGEVIAIPTDTVYGLAAIASDEKAVDEIFTLKRRPASTPLVTMVADIEDVMKFVNKLPPGFDTLVGKYWPGPLTIVVPVECERVSDRIRAGLNTAGFRIPDHNDLRKLLRFSGPVVAPSANIFGEDPALTAAEVEKCFGVDFPVFGGEDAYGGVPSTVICYIDGVWKVTREGAVSKGELMDLLSF